MSANQREDSASTKGCNYLGQANGAVEQPQVCSHVTIAFQRVGDEGKRHGQHGSPTTTDEKEGQDLSVLARHEWYQGKSDATKYQTDGIGHLHVAESWKDGCPYNGTHGLNGI